MELLIVTLLGLLGWANTVSAHVGYVLDRSDIDQFSGGDVNFLIQPLSNPTNLYLMGGTVAGIVLLYLGLSRLRLVKLLIEHIDEYARSYHDLVPWMARLSVGIALIGAGTSNVLISPVLTGYSSFAFIQILTGFLMLLGFLLGPATLVALCLYAYAIYQNIYMVGSLDFFALLVALLAWANPRPGLDDLIGVPQIYILKKLRPHVNKILRWGIGGAMIYLALYEKILNPHLSQLVVERFELNKVIPVSPDMWVLSAGLVELAVGLFLLIGFQVRLTAAVAFLVLTMSFFYFKEDVYSHITLFGLVSMIFTLGKKGPDT